MRKIGPKEALKRDFWFPKYVLPALGIVFIILALVVLLEGTFFFWVTGGLCLFMPFLRALVISNNMVECPGREGKECKELIYKWEKHCRYCGRENDLPKIIKVKDKEVRIKKTRRNF